MENNNENRELKFKKGKKEIFERLLADFNTLTNEYSVNAKFKKVYSNTEIIEEFNTYLKNKDINHLVDWVRTNLASIQKRNLGIVGENLENLKKTPEIFKFIEEKNFNETNLPKGFGSTGVLSPILHFRNHKKYAIINGIAFNLLSAFFDDYNGTNNWENYEESSNFIIEVGKVIKGDKKDDIAETIYFDRFAHWFSKKYGSHEIDTLNTVFYGPPGTGKTYSVNKRLEFLLSGIPKDDKLKYMKNVVFHPNYAYEDFIDGVKPRGFTENKQIKLELVNGHFKEFCIKVHRANLEFLDAKEDANKELPKYYFVVDEINRANLSAVFGETLMLLEDSYRYKYFNEGGVKIDEQMNKDAGRLITLKNSALCTIKENWFEKIDDEVLFGIPENIYFIGMMNDVDKSIDSFDLALRRRFAWKEMKCDFNALSDELEKYNKKEVFIECCENLNKFIINKDKLGLSESFQFGHAIYMNITKCLKSKQPIKESNSKDFFQKYISGTLKEYLRTEYPENEIQGKLKDAEEEFLKPFTTIKSKSKNGQV